MTFQAAAGPASVELIYDCCQLVFMSNCTEQAHDYARP